MINRLETPQGGETLSEEYFQNPEVLELFDFPKGRVEVVDIDPPEKKSEVPLMIIPGWALAADSYKENAKIFSGDLGRRSITISAPHGIEAELGANIPLAELRKVNAMMRVIEEKELDRVDVVAHSEGALFTTIAALEHPEKFRNIVLMSPAGLIGDDSFWQLAKRFNSDLLQQWKDRDKSSERKQKMKIALLDILKTLASPKKSLDEVKAIAEMRIQENLKELKRQGVGIVIVHPVNDKTFPMERIQQMVKSEMVDGFVSAGDARQTGETADTHNAWYLTPRKYTEAVDAILMSLERKEEER